MEKLSKSKQVLLHLLRHGSITPRQAIDLYQAFRLSSIINRLRHKGFTIITYETGETRYATYIMNKPEF